MYNNVNFPYKYKAVLNRQIGNTALTSVCAHFLDMYTIFTLNYDKLNQQNKSTHTKWSYCYSPQVSQILAHKYSICTRNCIYSPFRKKSKNAFIFDDDVHMLTCYRRCCCSCYCLCLDILLLLCVEFCCFFFVGFALFFGCLLSNFTVFVRTFALVGIPTNKLKISFYTEIVVWTFNAEFFEFRCFFLNI